MIYLIQKLYQCDGTDNSCGVLLVFKNNCSFVATLKENDSLSISVTNMPQEATTIENELERVEDFMEAFKLDPDNVGILLNPSPDSLAYHIRTYNHPMSPSLDWNIEKDKMEESYSEWVDKFKESLNDNVTFRYVEPELYEEHLIYRD